MQIIMLNTIIILNLGEEQYSERTIFLPDVRRDRQNKVVEAPSGFNKQTIGNIESFFEIYIQESSQNPQTLL